MKNQGIINFSCGYCKQSNRKSNPNDFNLEFKTLEDYFPNKSNYYVEDSIIKEKVLKHQYCSNKCYNNATKDEYLELIKNKSYSIALPDSGNYEDNNLEKEDLREYKMYLESLK